MFSIIFNNKNIPINKFIKKIKVNLTCALQTLICKSQKYCKFNVLFEIIDKNFNILSNNNLSLYTFYFYCIFFTF